MIGISLLISFLKKIVHYVKNISILFELNNVTYLKLADKCGNSIAADNNPVA